MSFHEVWMFWRSVCFGGESRFGGGCLSGASIDTNWIFPLFRPHWWQPLFWPELIRNANLGGPDASLPHFLIRLEILPNTFITLCNQVVSALGHVQDVFWVPCHLTKSYLSRAALGQPVWELFFTVRNRNQRQKKMTLTFEPAHGDSMKLRMWALLKISVFKPLHLPQSEPRTGTEIANAKMIRVEG